MIWGGVKNLPLFLWPLLFRKKTPRGAYYTNNQNIMNDLQQNFTMVEAVCKCGCSQHKMYMVNIVRHSAKLQALRDFLGKPIHINSWFRCPTHNRNVGGVSESQHLIGSATDIWVKDLNVDTLALMVLNAYRDSHIPRPFMIKYRSFLHLDFRG